MKIHQFYTQLDLSNSQSIRERNDSIYNQSIPDIKEIIHKPNDKDLQRRGIDTVIITSTRRFFIEEKNRLKDYGDIGLEVIHIPRTNREPWAGWADKPLYCDFILYTTPTSAILIPAVPFRQAWLKNKNQWIQWAKENRPGFSLRYAANNDYDTQSIYISIDTLWNAIFAQCFIPDICLLKDKD